LKLAHAPEIWVPYVVLNGLLGAMRNF